MLIATTCTSHMLFNPFGSKCRNGKVFFTKDIAIYSKLHVIVMVMDMLQQVMFPSKLSYATFYLHVSTSREVKPKKLR